MKRNVVAAVSAVGSTVAAVLLGATPAHAVDVDGNVDCAGQSEGFSQSAGPGTGTIDLSGSSRVSVGSLKCRINFVAVD